MLRKRRTISTAVTVVVLSLSSIMSLASSRGMKPQDGTLRRADLSKSKSLDGQSRTLLPDGRLLLTGGLNSGVVTSVVFFEDPKTAAQTESAGHLLYPRAFHSTTLLPTGNVLVFGGLDSAGATVDQDELFDAIKQGSTTISLTALTPRSHHTATLLTDGRVLIAGGLNGQGQMLSKIEIWDSRTGRSTTLTVALRIPRSEHTARLLSDGTVLLMGGKDENGSPLHDGEIIDPNGPSTRLVSRDLGSIQELEPPSLAASIPQSGETAVPIDQLIALRFSRAMNVTSLNSNSITLKTSTESVPVSVIPAEEGMLAFISPASPLEYGSAYTLSVSGTLDAAGQTMPATSILFTTVIADEIIPVVGGGEGSGYPSPSGSAGNGGGSSGAPLPNSALRKLAPLQGDEGVTALAGQVLTVDGSPLPNVLVEIDGEHATTDNTGRFLIRNTGSGHHVMIVDGGPASSKTSTYGIYRVGVDLKAGQTNSLNYTFWMTPLDMEHEVTISSPTTADVIVTNPNVPGLELHIPKGTVIHDAYGKVVTKVGITPIPMKQPPFPLKRGVQFPVYFTIQREAPSLLMPVVPGVRQGAAMLKERRFTTRITSKLSRGHATSSGITIRIRRAGTSTDTAALATTQRRLRPKKEHRYGRSMVPWSRKQVTRHRSVLCRVIRAKANQ